MPSVRQLLLVASGGALGSVLRYLVANVLYPLGRGLPLGTFVINVTGSLAIGFLGGMWSGEGAGHPGRLLLMVGVLGGYTTFSSFELETLSLANQGMRLQALGYVLASCLLGFGAVALGMWAGKRV
ncbi:MAG: fluoride efflux transporter CrcB [Deltaproteobacteria bacterium]|nr:fluoride efflux transporter CrcB [Deltaproteobacteria bacterium]